MDIKLTPEIESALAKQARRQGTTAERLALDALREKFVEPTQQEPSQEIETLADFLDGYIGVLHSTEQVPGGARMSEVTGRKFAEGIIKS